MAWGGQDTARVIAPPPLIYLGVWLGSLALDRLLRLPQLPISDAARYSAAAVMFVLGAALGLWALTLFKQAGTNVVPNRPTTALVTHGPFRWSRNPGYICQTLIYVSFAVAAASWTALLLLAPLLVLIDRAVVLREERYLEAKFGGEYRAYAARVRRWL